MKDKKEVNVLKKIDNVLKYSDVHKGMTRKERKTYLKNNNTLILDTYRFFYFYSDINFNDLKTLIIDEQTLKDSPVIINDCTANDIYINNHENLGGITIPYNYLINNPSIIQFVWNKLERTEIEKINIVLNDCIKTIETKLIEKIDITIKNNLLLIKIENYNSIISYKINSLGNIEKEYIAREIKENDITNNILDLREFNKFEKIVFEKLKIDKLIINKETIKNIFKYSYIFSQLNFKKIVLIDDNEMKLMPTNIIVDINELDELIKTKNDYSNIIYIKNKDNPRIIYLDKIDNIKVLDKDSVMKDENTEDAKICIDSNYNLQTTNFLILIKSKNNKYKVIINEKEYILTSTFKNFLLLNKELFVPDVILEDLKNNNWFNIIGKYTFTYSGFLSIYNAYLKYKERLDKLKKLGFSYNALMYLHDRKINSIINTETEENLIELNDIKQYEINSYNLLGEEYIKVKRLKK